MKTTTILALATLLLAACEQDAYDKGDGRYSLLTAELVEAHTGADGKVTTVVTDEGERLELSKPVAASWMQTPDSVYRAYLYYNRQGGSSQVEPVSMGRVTTLAHHAPDYFADGVKTDPVRFESAWVSTSRRYLNLGLYIMVGQANSEDALHRVGLVSDTLMANADQTLTRHLHLYHDQGGVPQYYSQRLYLSIPLSGETADSLRLSIATYDGVVTRSFRIAQ